MSNDKPQTLTEQLNDAVVKEVLDNIEKEIIATLHDVLKKRDTKQVIIIRKDLKMRRGKEISQAAHGSLAFISRQLENGNRGVILTPAQAEWLESSYKKITVTVNSEEELLAIYDQAKEKGIESHLVTDKGLTEFHNIPTHTCVVLGPDYNDVLDPLTKHLPLY
jgi:PTH2 family peptidyl-tRNA hydrolase